MAKAINWPIQFRDEVIAEDCEHETIALRLGTLYYENQYWVPGEIVDIRVNHKKIRKAVVVGNLRRTTIQDLTLEDFNKLKEILKNQEAIMQFLSQTYNQPVDANTLVTIVTYLNHPVIPEEMEEQDDPHL